MADGDLLNGKLSIDFSADEEKSSSRQACKQHRFSFYVDALGHIEQRVTYHCILMQQSHF